MATQPNVACSAVSGLDAGEQAHRGGRRLDVAKLGRPS